MRKIFLLIITFLTYSAVATETSRFLDLPQNFIIEPNYVTQLKRLASDTNFISELKQKAEQGLASAQNVLGFCYYAGRGVPHDFNVAAYWFTKAANQGFAAGQCMLAECYYGGGGQGQGIGQDYKQAVYWHRKAAEQGYVLSQFELGNCYYDGKGIAQDFNEAIRWYTKAAEWGFADAQNRLGFMFNSGKGIQQDYKEAVKWFTKAAEQGLAKAQCNLGTMYAEGKGVPQNYDEAKKWFTRSAEQGYTPAKQNLVTLLAKATFSVGYFSYAVQNSLWANYLPPSFDEKADAIFLIVSLTVKNNDKEARTIPLFKLIDENGAEYEMSNKGLGDEYIGIIDSLNPGVQKKGLIAFDVPQNHKYKLKVSGGYWSNESALIELSPTASNWP